MPRKAVLLILSLALAAMLAASACSTAGPTTTQVTTTGPTGGPTTTTTAAPTPSDKPQYGGIITMLLSADVNVFDPVTMGQLIGPAVAWTTNEQWIQYDWSRGLAGTGQTDWMNPGQGLDDFWPYLAESVSYPEPGIMVLKVRQGVHYGLNPKSEASRLVNGREMTADDWVANMNEFLNHPMAFVKNNYPWMVDKIKVTKTGPWEVTFDISGDLADEMRAWHWLVHGGGYHFLFPPELWTKYGNLQNWKNNVGTGAWMLTDFVPGSTVTLEKNPRFWGEDPVGPGKGNQLPYADGVKMLILPDLSARLAAVRTGKADFISAITADDAKSLKQTNPQLQSAKYLPGPVNAIGMRADKPDLPYKDKRVRQALMMATDFNGLVQALGGEAEILVYPLNKTFKRAYMPLSELPTNVQELYTYHPDKAKDLLAAAGYPNGFKSTIICSSDPAVVDTLSAYKAMWAKVNVELDIQPKEFGVYAMRYFGHQNEDMLFGTEWGIFPVYLYFGSMSPGNFANMTNVNWPAGSEPTIQAAYDKVTALSFNDPAGADKVIRDLMPYVLENAWYIEQPQPYQYSFWWPWLKNYHGENNSAFLQYYWVDESLKTTIGK